MGRYGVYLRSPGTNQQQGLIRIHMTLSATDDVDAAMQAKAKASKRFKNRADAPWYADHVEKLEAV